MMGAESRQRKKIRRVVGEEIHSHRQSYLRLRKNTLYDSYIRHPSTYPALRKTEKGEKNPYIYIIYGYILYIYVYVYNALNFSLPFRKCFRVVDYSLTLIIFPQAPHFSRPQKVGCFSVYISRSGLASGRGELHFRFITFAAFLEINLALFTPAFKKYTFKQP